MSFGIRLLTWTLGLSPFVLAVLVHVARPSAPLSIAAPPRPALAFDQYLVDLAQVAVTSEIRGHFAFENRGSSPVEITEVTPSCGCLVPLISARRIAPGERGAILLRMQPANEAPGKKEYFADIRYTDPEPRSVRLTFRLELPERQMTVRPRALAFYQSGNASTSRTITVTDTRDRPARVLNVEVTNPLVTVAPAEERTGEDGERLTDIEVTVAGNVPVGRHDVLLKIETSDPASPVLRVPLMIYGRAAE